MAIDKVSESCDALHRKVNPAWTRKKEVEVRRRKAQTAVHNMLIDTGDFLLVANQIAATSQMRLIRALFEIEDLLTKKGNLFMHFD